MPTLIELLAVELERPRAVSTQVVKHLVETYGIDRDAVGPFLVNQLPSLEDYQVDLALSPLFTPILQDQAVFAEFLGRDSVPPGQWPALIGQLATRPTCAQLVTEDGQTHSMPLREVTLERFVHRLRLDGTIAEPLSQLITHLLPAAERPLLKAVARRAIWESESRCQILEHFLASTAKNENYRTDDALELLRLVEAHEPADMSDLRARVPHWQQVLRQQISEAGGPKPFFNERVQELHGGGRDQRRPEDSRLMAKEKELAFLERLERTLGSP